MDDDIIRELLDTNINFTGLDEILKNELPKDIVNIINDYIKPCKLCNKCCQACKFYCYDRCLRYDERINIIRDSCCIGEFNREMIKYDKYKKTK